MDQKVQDDIQELSASYHYSWLDPIIQVKRDAPNPYLDEKYTNLNIDQNLLANPIGGIYAQNENIISFNDNPITKSNENTENDDTNQIQLSSFVIQTQPLSNSSQSNIITKFSSSFNLQNSQNNLKLIPGFVLKNTIKICKIEHPSFEFIEPIMFSAFLYSRQTKTVISEIWNFFPEECSPFMSNYSPDVQNFQSATFEIDPTKNPSLMSYDFIIFASHPVKKDRGQAAINYYTRPGSDTAQLFHKENAKYPDQQISTFATFAFAFFDFKGIPQKPDSDPLGLQFFKIDRMPAEKEISQLHINVVAKKFEQIDLRIRISKNDTESDLIIRQISARRPLPLMYPINQAILRIDSLSTPQPADYDPNAPPTYDCGYAVMIECRDNDVPIEIIRSNFNPTKFVQNQTTKLCYPPSSTNFNESFLLNLPFPITPKTVINFTLLKCNFASGKGKSKTPFTVDIVGTQNISILDDFVDEYCKVLFPNENMLSIRLCMISSMHCSNKNLYSFLSSAENPSFSLLQGITSSQYVTYLHTILNKFIRKLIIYDDTEFVEEFIKMCEAILKDTNLKFKNNYNIAADDLSVFLLSFVRFFAFTPIELNEIQNHIASRAQNNAEVNTNQSNENTNKFVPNSNFSNLHFPQKLFLLLTHFLKTHDNGIEQLSPYFDFFFSLIAKYLYLIKPQKCGFGDEFGLFVLQFIKFSASSANFSQLICSYAIFINLLYECGYSEVAVEAVKVILMNWPEKTDTPTDDDKLIKPKNDFIETLFKPSFFAILVKNSKEFQDIVIGLIKGGYDSITTSPEPSRLFDILFRLSEVFDTNMNQIISSRLVEAMNFFQPGDFSGKESILSPSIYFLYLLVNCEKPPSSKKIFDGLHYLLTKVYKQNARIEELRSSNMNPGDLSPKDHSQIEGKKKVKKSGTFAIRKKTSDLTNYPSLIQNSIPTLKEEKEAKLFMNYTNKSVFDLIIKLEKSENLQIPSIISLIFHLLTVTKELELIEKIIFILNYYMSNFKMNFIMTKSPALVRILSKFFNLSIISTNKKPLSSDRSRQEQDQSTKTPTSSRTRSRAVSFTAKKLQSMDNQKQEPNEAPENTSFRNESINLGRLEYQKNQDLKTAADRAAAQYATVSISLNIGNNQGKHLPPLDIKKAQEQGKKELKITEDYLIFDETVSSEDAMNRINSYIAEFINSIFMVDTECNNNNKISTIILMRAISSLEDKQIISDNISKLFLQIRNSENYVENDALNKCIETYTKISEIIKQIIKNNETDFIYEEHCELLFKLFKLYEKSPDAQVDVLERLYRLHIEKGFPFEAASVSILQASIIFENLTACSRMTNYFRLSHPCFVLKEICGICADVQTHNFYKKKSEIVPGYCDSFMFNEQGMVSLLYRALEDCSNNKVLKLASILLDLCWPIFEYWHSYNELQVMFSKFNAIFSSLVDDSEDQDAFADRFFRVTFYGQKLKDMDGKTYIYRQKPLTHLYDFTNNIISKYSDIYGKDNIVQISESGKVDTTKLDLVNKVYIQITFVEPYIRGSKEKNSNNDNYTQFFYDTPFVKTDDNSSDIGKAHQATMDKQWIRKTILTTEFELPSVLIRSEVNPSSIEEKDLEPIKVVCRQIRDRTKQLEKALESNDMMKTQQLLHGSLLVQVNEGPAKIADVFLGDETKNKSKAADKLREAFILFMRQLRKGVSVHGKLTTQNPEFQPLQDELEAGYESLKNKLSPLCFKNTAIKPSLSSFGSSTSQINFKQIGLNNESSSSSIIDSQTISQPIGSSNISNLNETNDEGNT